MSRITLNAANYAAEKIADVVYNEKIDKAKKKLQEFVDSLYTTHVPLVLRELATLYPQLVNTETMIGFTNKGLGYIIKYTSEPHLKLNSISLSDQEFRELKQLTKEYNEIRDERVSYLRAVSKYLVNLKTTNAVKREFPEALKYLGGCPKTNEDGAFVELRSKLQQVKNENC